MTNTFKYTHHHIIHISFTYIIEILSSSAYNGAVVTACWRSRFARKSTQADTLYNTIVCASINFIIICFQLLSTGFSQGPQLWAANWIWRFSGSGFSISVWFWRTSTLLDCFPLTTLDSLFVIYLVSIAYLGHPSILQGTRRCTTNEHPLSAKSQTLTLWILMNCQTTRTCKVLNNDKLHQQCLLHSVEEKNHHSKSIYRILLLSPSNN